MSTTHISPWWPKWRSGDVCRTPDRVVATPRYGRVSYVHSAGAEGSHPQISVCAIDVGGDHAAGAQIETQLHGDEQIHTLPTKSGRGKVYVHARFVKVLTENATADDVMTSPVSTSNTRQQSDAAQVLTADSGSPSLLEDRHSVYVSTSARQHVSTSARQHVSTSMKPSSSKGLNR